MSTQDVDLLVDMGFNRENASKALEVTGNQGVEPAMEWLLAHSGDLQQASAGPEPATIPVSATIPVPASSPGPASTPDPANTPDPVISSETKTDEMDTSNPVEASESGESSTVQDSELLAKSFKCNECGKLFVTQIEVEYHAAKSGHSDFAESIEEKKPLSEEEKAEQLRRLEEKLKLKRKEREERERSEALEREKHRIRSGKEMTEAKKRLEEQEIRKMAELRRKEKEDDKRARDRVRAQIEADKAARKAKAEAAAAAAKGIVIPTPAPAPAPVPVPQPIPTVQKDYTQTRLQIRLTNGQALTQTFGAKEALSAVRLYIDMNRTDGDAPFSLMTSFPKKVFAPDDFEKPLDILGLVPSSVLILCKPSQY